MNITREELLDVGFEELEPDWFTCPKADPEHENIDYWLCISFNKKHPSKMIGPGGFIFSNSIPLKNLKDMDQVVSIIDVIIDPHNPGYTRRLKEETK